MAAYIMGKRLTPQLQPYLCLLFYDQSLFSANHHQDFVCTYSRLLNLTLPNNSLK